MLRPNATNRPASAAGADVHSRRVHSAPTRTRTGKCTRNRLKEIFPSQLMTPIFGQRAPQPAFSALKHQGRPLYYYARQGIQISKPARPVQIYSLTAENYRADCQQVDIRVTCSRGTYVRVLAADIGNALGCGAHLIALRRTASGLFQVEDAVDGRFLFEETGADALLAARISVKEALAKVAAG